MNLGIAPRFNTPYNQPLRQANYNNSLCSYSRNNSGKIAPLNFTSTFNPAKQEKIIEFYVKYCRKMQKHTGNTDASAYYHISDLCNMLDPHISIWSDYVNKFKEYGFKEGDIKQLCKHYCNGEPEKFDELLIKCVSDIKKSTDLSYNIGYSPAVILNYKISQLGLDESLTIGRKDYNVERNPTESFNHLCEFSNVDTCTSRKHAKIFRNSKGELSIQNITQNSTSYINEHPIFGLTPIKQGDIIKLGNVEIPILCN